MISGVAVSELRDYLDSARWDVAHRSVVVAFGIASEVIVTRKR